MFKINGKSSVVLGGGRGIGAAISCQLAKEGAHTIIIDTNETISSINHYQTKKIRGFEEALKIANNLSKKGLSAKTIDVDACNESSLVKTLRSIGRIDILVNAIGSTYVKHTIDTTTDEFQSIINTNLIAPYVACREAAKIMKQNNQGGSIINISSISGKMGFPGIPSYCAAKFGLIGFTISLALELAESAIQVNAICPGIVKTNMWKYLQEQMAEQNESDQAFWVRMLDLIPQKKSQSLEDIANFVISIIKNEAITGQSLSIDGGWNRCG